MCDKKPLPRVPGDVTWMTIQQDKRDRRIAELERVVRMLLRVVPRPGRRSHECWEWCWNELDEESELLVVETRREAERALNAETEQSEKGEVGHHARRSRH